MWLEFRSGDDSGRLVEIPHDPDRPFVLGRVQGADVIVRDERASRRHLQLQPLEGGGLALKDLGSANGTLLDGEPVQEATLGGGEEIQIGAVRIGVLTERPEPKQPNVATMSMVQRMVDTGHGRARRVAYIAVGVAVLAVGAAIVLGGGAGKDQVPEIVRAMAPSTVLVESLRDGARVESGSGWVLDGGQGLVVTNGHVVNQGVEHRVTVGGRPTDAQVVGVAPCEDLAVLKVQNTQGLRSAPLGDGAEQGERVVALGYPADASARDELTSTTGVVSVAKTAFDDPAPDVPPYPEAIQTDTALNPGNSGGPLVDLDGRVIGVNAAARTTGADRRPLQNQNYAIAIGRARQVVGELRGGRSLGWFGALFAYPTLEELTEQRLPPGLRLAGAVRDTPAARAGLGKGELLVAVNGTPVRETLASYCEAVASVDAGAELTLTLHDADGRTREVEIATV